MAHLLEQIVQISGHTVQVYSDPTTCPIYKDHGFECTRKTPCADVIISDQKMPNISGLDFFKLQKKRGCKALSQNKALISASDIPNDLKNEMDALGVHYIRKPFRIDTLLEWINECLVRVQSAPGQSEERGLILVEMQNGTRCRITKTALKIFLARGEIKRFKRSDGWFTFGADQLRDPKNDKKYTGIERREAV